MCNEALFTPKHTTLETIRTLGALLLTVSTSNLAGFAFFNGQHINQAVQIKTGGKIFQIATIRHFANNLAFRASDCVSAMAWSVPVFQALQTETVKTWEVLWIFVYVSTHWTRNFFTKIVEQRFDIHGSSVFFEERARTVASILGSWLETMKSCDFVLFSKLVLLFVMVVFSTASANQGSFSVKHVMECFVMNTDSQERNFNPQVSGYC